MPSADEEAVAAGAPGRGDVPDADPEGEHGADPDSLLEGKPVLEWTSEDWARWIEKAPTGETHHEPAAELPDERPVGGWEPEAPAAELPDERPVGGWGPEVPAAEPAAELPDERPVGGWEPEVPAAEPAAEVPDERPVAWADEPMAKPEAGPPPIDPVPDAMVSPPAPTPPAPTSTDDTIADPAWWDTLRGVSAPQPPPPPAPAPEHPTTVLAPLGADAAAPERAASRPAPATASSTAILEPALERQPPSDAWVRLRSALGLLAVAVLVGALVAALVSVTAFGLGLALRRALG